MKKNPFTPAKLIAHAPIVLTLALGGLFAGIAIFLGVAGRFSILAVLLAGTLSCCWFLLAAIAFLLQKIDRLHKLLQQK